MFNYIGFILGNWVRGNFEPGSYSLFTPLESPGIYARDALNIKSQFLIEGGVTTPSFLTGFATNVLAEDRADLIEIEANFEGSNISTVKREKGNQFALTMRPDLPSDYKYPNHPYYWFYFKVSGVKNKTVTINITNCEWMPNHWENYKPIYTYSNDPNDLEDHNWNVITNTSRSRKTFTFTHTFAQDSAFIALRYPYNYSRLKKYLLSIEKNPYVSVKALGNTREGREIYALMVTDKAVPDSKKKGIWVVAKEHGAEHDGAWAIEGMMKYLIRDDPKVIALRRNTVFVLIPVAAPDAAYHGRVVNPVTGFDVSTRYDATPIFPNRPGGMTEETKAIWTEVQKWIEKGHTLDIAVSFHNPHGEEENVWGIFSSRFKGEEHRKFHVAFLKYLSGYTVKTQITSHPPFKNIFPGRCSTEFGSLGFIYEINQHAKGKFLSIQDLYGIGESFTKGVFDYFEFSIES
jgi:hypothetical protein